MMRSVISWAQKGLRRADLQKIRAALLGSDGLVGYKRNEVTGVIAFSGAAAGQKTSLASGAAWANVRALLRAQFGKSASGGLGHIGFGGDSTAAGTGATNPDTYSIGGALRSLMDARGVPSAGTGLVPQYRESGSSPMWSGSGWSDFGRTSNLMQGSTARTFTSSVAGTVVSVMYGNSGASFDISIDGGSATRVTTNITDTFATWTSGVLANTTHTVVITPVSGSAHIYGAEVRKSSGLRVSNFGIGGSKSSEICSTSAWFNTLRAVVAAGVKVYFVRGFVNDMGNGVAQATTISSMLAGFAYLRANGVEPVYLAPCFWQDHDADVYAQSVALCSAASDAGYAAYASPVVYGGYANALALGLSADALHPSDAGYTADALELSACF